MKSSSLLRCFAVVVGEWLYGPVLLFLAGHVALCFCYFCLCFLCVPHCLLLCDRPEPTAGQRFRLELELRLADWQEGAINSTYLMSKLHNLAARLDQLVAAAGGLRGDLFCALVLAFGSFSLAAVAFSGAPIV